MVKQRQRRLYKSCVGVSAFILLALFGFGAGLVSAITLEGSGSSYARFPRWHQAFENVLSVELRTKKPNALLIYIDDSGLGNFYEISIFEGKIRLQFRLGARQLKNNATATQLALNGTTAKLLQIEEVQVDDGQWHRVVLYHFWETVKLQVDQSVVFSKVLDQQDFVFADYEQSSDVYVGGLPVAMQASSLSFPFAKALPRFEEQCRMASPPLLYYKPTAYVKVTTITVQRRQRLIVRDMAFVTVRILDQCATAISVVTVTLVCQTVVGNVTRECRQSFSVEAVTFVNGHSSLALTNRWTGGNDGQLVAFKFRTNEPYGLLLHCGPAEPHLSDLLAVEIFAGHLYFVIDLGSGTSRLQASGRLVADGHWHSVNMTRRWRSGQIYVDNWRVDFSTPGKEKMLDTADVVQFGYSVAEARNLPPSVWTATLGRGFVGCLKDVTLDGVSLDLIGLLPHQRQRDVVVGCYDMLPQCTEVSCKNGGRCIEGWNRYYCDCSANVHWDVKLRENYWHSVALFRTGQRLELVLDGDRLAEKEILSFVQPFQLRYDRLYVGSAEVDALADQREKMFYNENDHHFHGEMADFQFNGLQVLTLAWHGQIGHSGGSGAGSGLWAVGDVRSTNVLYSAERDFVISFQADSFAKVSLEKPTTVTLDKLEVSFTFRTTEKNGVLLYRQGDSRNFLLLELFNGRLICRFNSTDYKHALQSNHPLPLNDHNWHHVVFYDSAQHTGEIRLVVDNYTSNWSSDSVRPMPVRYNASLVIGYPGVEVADRLVDVLPSGRGFQGCMVNLKIDGSPVRLLQDSEMQANLRRGCTSELLLLEIFHFCATWNSRSKRKKIHPNFSEMCPRELCIGKDGCPLEKVPADCDCLLTEISDLYCLNQSVAYRFGPRPGTVLFRLDENSHVGPVPDRVLMGIVTYQADAVVMQMVTLPDSRQTFELLIENGYFAVKFRDQYGETVLSEKSIQLNDGQYHFVQFNRSRLDLTLQIDQQERVVTKMKGMYVCVCVGGWMGGEHDKIANLHSTLKICPSSPTGQASTTTATWMKHTDRWIALGGRFDGQMQTKRRQFRRGSSLPFNDAFYGILSSVLVNDYRLLELASSGDERVILVGDVRRHHYFNYNESQLNHLEHQQLETTIPNEETTTTAATVREDIFDSINDDVDDLEKITSENEEALDNLQTLMATDPVQWSSAAAAAAAAAAASATATTTTTTTSIDELLLSGEGDGQQLASCSQLLDDEDCSAEQNELITPVFRFDEPDETEPSSQSSSGSSTSQRQQQQTVTEPNYQKTTIDVSGSANSTIESATFKSVTDRISTEVTTTVKPNDTLNNKGFPRTSVIAGVSVGLVVVLTLILFYVFKCRQEPQTAIVADYTSINNNDHNTDDKSNNISFDKNKHQCNNNNKLNECFAQSMAVMIPRYTSFFPSQSKSVKEWYV
ncbi:Neurexin-1a [Trichinella sp. T8]|nr:Neurexin-1a [Trichinella sp. T8]